MNIPPYWSRVREGRFVATGWSEASPLDAERAARENAREIARKVTAGGFLPRQEQYYGDRPVREEILREFVDSSGRVSALMTRNVYGSLVLNAERLLIVDVDLPETPRRQPTSLISSLAGLFGKVAPVPDVRAPEKDVIARAEAWVRAHAPWRWRIYRTKAGLRLLATHAEFEGADPVVSQVFEALGADPLYRKLCRLQKCFRARLTPKPWRCGTVALSVPWPFIDGSATQRFLSWQADYLQKCRAWKTCELVTDFGSGEASPAFTELIGFHDETARIDENLPLA